ncbi:MAG: hypothetical protein GH150_04680 [Hadesarchaea archaeon]|nr:hypothetical protein [Hadesarchaea archaeon]
MRYIFLDCETTGLSPLAHRVVCIGTKVGTEEHVLMDKDEKKMLEEFINTIAEGDVLVGYNTPFDVGFLVLRSLKHGVDPRKLLGRTQIDLMQKVRGLTREKYVSLREVAVCFGLNYGKANGASVPELWETGEHGPIREHCLSDVRVTEQLFEKLKPLVVELATDPQKSYMRRLGVLFDKKTTKDEASRLIDESKKGRGKFEKKQG